MKGFNFEKNLPHQERAVNSTVAMFEGLRAEVPKGIDAPYFNPFINQKIPFDRFEINIKKVQKENSIEHKNYDKSNIIDIMMETGTGKTYTYTKTIFELNKNFGIFKFVIVVPTLSIKAGTVNFLKSDSCREHFFEQYNKKINLHIVESQKNNKNKKQSFPTAVSNFVKAEKFDQQHIQVLLINAGMINSDTMQAVFHTNLMDKYAIPLEAIAATKPFLIIDEPHKFAKDNKTWDNIQKLKPQFILRYGATFPEKEIDKKDVFTGKKEKIKVKDYHNLIYTLSAVDAFNRNLVKGIEGHIIEFDSDKTALVTLLETDGKEAIFQLKEGTHSEQIKIGVNELMEKVHSAMTDLKVENINKSIVSLSNGLELKKGSSINPYSYAPALQEIMLRQAIKRHFEVERLMLTREIKIKPLTLFFIDNIDEYRGKNDKKGIISTTLEQLIEAEVKHLLLTENNVFYKNYLEKTLIDLSKTHGGYFSKDNSEKDEAIEKEINEILHDKQALLSLDNPRRFIFSKWTLKEGWDNPNVFQICKMRSSGSEISRLQEVGRGLRLPVNEYGNRVKGEQFYLNYFVDFTEKDFIEKLKAEINDKSGAISIDDNLEKLSDNLIKLMLEKYQINDENLLMQKLIMEEKVIDFSRKFLAGGYDYIKKNYALIFEGVNSNKIKIANNEKQQVTIRTEKYAELKDLWEKLNEKVILEYKIANETEFKRLFTDFLIGQKENFSADSIKERTIKLKVDENDVTSIEEIAILDNVISPVPTMKYSDFLKELSQKTYINIKTLHQSFIDAELDINPYRNNTTIRIIKHNFDNYLMFNAISQFGIEYQKVTSSIHPTKFTDKNGKIYESIAAADIGLSSSKESVAHNYFFNELFYDSELEKENIKTNPVSEIAEVVVFTKIPKNSIKIPVAGGRSYSPDFAYVLNYKDNSKKLYFVVEAKNVGDENNLRKEEIQKILHAEKFFDNKIEIKFKTQFSNKKIENLIKEIL